MMVKKIRLLLEYQTFPMWLHDEDDDIIDTDMPPEWADDTALEKAFMDISDYYDTLFIDNEKEFTYLGYTEEQKRKIEELISVALEMLYKKNNGKYIIVNDFHLYEE